MPTLVVFCVVCRLNVTKWALLVSLIVVLLVAVKRLRRMMYLAMTICGFDAGLLATVWVKTYCNVLCM